MQAVQAKYEAYHKPARFS